MTFGEKIQKLRKEAGLSQEELSDQLRVSRQAVSKWERDSGYPETDKIVRMSRIFHVTMDYLLKEETGGQADQEPEGLYVSRETADGFLADQRRRLRKIGTAAGLIVGDLALAFWDSPFSMIVFMVVLIMAALLLCSVGLADHPYRKLWREKLTFDKAVKAELASAYAEKKQPAHRITLAGIALIAVGVLLCPMLVPEEMDVLDNAVLTGGMLLAGAGAFLCVVSAGMVRAYRLLVLNEEYRQERK